LAVTAQIVLAIFAACATITTLAGLRVCICASAYFSPSWTAFQADRGRYFSVIVDGISN
jgi:hypothetical protein